MDFNNYLSKLDERTENLITNFLNGLTFEKFDKMNAVKINSISHSVLEQQVDLMVNGINLILTQNNHPLCFCEGAWKIVLDEERSGASLIRESLNTELSKLVLVLLNKLDSKIKSLLWLTSDNWYDDLENYTAKEQEAFNCMEVMSFVKQYSVSFDSVIREIVNKIYLKAEEENALYDNYDIELFYNYTTNDMH